MANSQLTVVQILPALDSGGVERGTIEIADALAAAGHRSIVISAGGRLVSELTRSNSDHVTWPIGAKHLRTLALVRPLRQYLSKVGADIVHVRSRLPAWITWLTWRRMNPLTRPRLVTTVHGFYSVNRYSAIMTKGERVVAVSNSIRDYIVTAYPQTDATRIRVIERGIDHEQYPFGFEADPAWIARWRKETGLDSKTKVLMLVGRLTRLKGHEQFIALIKRLQLDGHQVHGVIVGGEDARRVPYAQSLYAAAADLPVSFLGHRSDVRELMSIADLVLSLSSKPESFGRTVLEALALGRPALGYEHGGVGEILKALYPIGKVESGNEQALFDRVRQLLLAPEPVLNSDALSLQSMQNKTLNVYSEISQAPRY